MENLIRRVRVIQEQCADVIEKKGENLGDVFTNKKKSISEMMRRIRRQLKQRDELLEKGESQKAAELSQSIRNQMKQVKNEIEKLGEIQRQEAKQARKMPPEIQKAVASRAEIVELCNKHLIECENIEKGRFQESKERQSLLAKSKNDTDSKVPKSKDTYEMQNKPFGSPSSSMPSEASNQNQNYDSSPFDDEYESNLDDIDNVTDELLLLEERNKEIDSDLDAIAEGVKKLKEIAISMNDELKLQNQMIDQIETKVDKTGTQLETLNSKLKKTLDNVMKGDKFLVSFVLLCVILALIAFVASLFT